MQLGDRPITPSNTSPCNFEKLCWFLKPPLCTVFAIIRVKLLEIYTALVFTPPECLSWLWSALPKVFSFCLLNTSPLNRQVPQDWGCLPMNFFAAQIFETTSLFPLYINIICSCIWFFSNDVNRKLTSTTSQTKKHSALAEFEVW